ncbi:MAG: endopeptidase La [Oscillospiraceae bacterium]|nr:endopeptidase La [Oscillospiraceae bacterium]
MSDQKVKIKIERSAEKISLPAIALRGLVVFPTNVIHFEVGRKHSIAAIEWAMEHNTPVFLVTQKDIDQEAPHKEDLYSYGVVANVKQLLQPSGEMVKVLVEGKYRGKLMQIDASGPFLMAEVRMARLRKTAVNKDRCEALTRQIKEAFETYIGLSPRLPREVVFTIIANDDPEFLSEFIPSNLLLKYQDKQTILDQNTLEARLEKLLDCLRHENNVLSIERDIEDRANQEMDKSQRDYYLREQMNAIAEELGEGEDPRSETENYRAKIKELGLPDETEQKLLKEVDRLVKMQGSSQEAAVIRSYLDTCLELPWKEHTEDRIDLKKAQNILEKEHYGLIKVKERILELLAVRKLAPDIKGQIICLAGPPGIGKTSIAHSIAACMGRKYARISLGGVRDEAEIRGHRRTYVGAMPGKLMATMSQVKSYNPVILLDEIDKLAGDFRGDPAAALLEALDPEQNAAFHDHYLDIPFDLSEVLFITTANTLDSIPRPLLDRMDVIELTSYTRNEKFQIAKRHLIPKQLAKTGLAGKVRFQPTALYKLIDEYTAEAGVRTLERTITEVLRKCARKIAEGSVESIVIASDKLEVLLGPQRHKPSYFNRTNTVGIANGLAWTSIGGELLPIEVQLIEPGSGKLQLTGSLGDVMKESAHLAITYAKVHAAEYGIEAEKFEKADIHIHAPEGAVPKDGPSAGVTLASALISALAGIPVRADVAMTGEITLHGMVLPIGGLKEKSMAAYKEGIHTVLIPKDNVPDLYEIDQQVKEFIQFLPISTVKEVLAADLMMGTKSFGRKTKAVKKSGLQAEKNDKQFEKSLPQ